MLPGGALVRAVLMGLALGPALGLAQTPADAAPAGVLTLDQALRMARERNGTIQASLYQVKAAGAREQEAGAAFWPTITPEFQYNSNRSEIATTIGNQFIQDEGGFTTIVSSFTLLDSGDRNYAYQSSRKAFQAQRFTARQSIRSVLFDVQQQYYDALRAQELERVAQSQVARANTILDQTKARVAVKDEARKDILQATADALNAQVQVLQAKNNTSTTAAVLKSTVGLRQDAPLPPLETEAEPTDFPSPGDLRMLIEEGVRNRPDLVAQRFNLESEHYLLLRAKQDASFGFTLNAGFDLQLTPDHLEDRTLTFLLTYPLFDGGLLRAQAREIGYDVESDRATLAQAERVVRSDVESAFEELSQDVDRVRAAKAALDAARENYQAAVESQKLGASDLIEVLTAQVSLATAESDFIQAVYDYKISLVRLNLVTGRPIPGE